MASVTPLLADYKSTEQALLPLQSADGALAQAAASAGQVASRVGGLEAAVSRTEGECTTLESRINRNENPRCFHYLICNRKARAARFREELEGKRDVETKQKSDLANSTEELMRLRQVESQARGTADTKHQLEARLGQLFDQVVSSQPVTPVLQDLHNRKAAQSNAIMGEKGLLAAMQQTDQFARSGIQHFEAARQTLMTAERENEMAMRSNQQERRAEMREGFAENRGDGFAAGNAEWQAENAQRHERMLQAGRDRHINQACSQASEGYRAMHAALFSSFPQEARQRYPQLCMQIGHTPFPMLQGASGFQTGMADLFGPAGGMMNEFGSENKIMQNLQIVQQCENIAQQQHRLIVTLVSTIGGGVAQMEQSLAQIHGSIEAERRRIFAAVMASNGQTYAGSAQASGQPVAAQGLAQPMNAQPVAPTPAPAQALPMAVAVAAPQPMVVTCPEGAAPGTSIQIQTPNGQTMAVEVPAGVMPGGQFQVQF